jgi:hypothetical protein
MSCAQCGATLAIPSLRDANAAVQALAPALRANAAHPPPEIVRRRLDALDADLPRRREWAETMEREANQRNSDVEWRSLFRRGRAALIALAILFVWWRLWRR